jgi:hypothetical protein
MTLYGLLLFCLIASIAGVAIDLVSYGRLAAYLERQIGFPESAQPRMVAYIESQNCVTRDAVITIKADAAE